MKNKSLLVLVLTLLPAFAFAQKELPRIGCVDAALRLQAQEMIQTYTAQNYTVFRDAMLGMKSDVAFPVIVSLKKGHVYRILFVGNKYASKMELELYDFRNKNIASYSAEPLKTDASNIISVTFNPAQDGNYQFILLQKRKNSSCCGSFTILESETDAGTDEKDIENISPIHYQH